MIWYLTVHPEKMLVALNYLVENTFLFIGNNRYIRTIISNEIVWSETVVLGPLAYVYQLFTLL